MTTKIFTFTLEPATPGLDPIYSETIPFKVVGTRPGPRFSMVAYLRGEEVYRSVAMHEDTARTFGAKFCASKNEKAEPILRRAEEDRKRKRTIYAGWTGLIRGEIEDIDAHELDQLHGLVLGGRR